MADEILVDPDWLRHGPFGELGAYEDAYFEPAEQTSALGHAVDRLVDSLHPDERRCVELRIYGGLPYSAVAVELGWFLSDGTANRKRSWRAVRRALRKLKAAIEDRADWLAAIGDERLADLPDDEEV